MEIISLEDASREKGATKKRWRDAHGEGVPPWPSCTWDNPAASPRDRERMSKCANMLQTAFWEAKLAPVVPYRG